MKTRFQGRQQLSRLRLVGREVAARSIGFRVHTFPAGLL